MMNNSPQPDRAEILRAVRRMTAPGQVVELRALNVVTGSSRPYTLSGYFDDPESLATAAARIRRAQGVYITLNPPNPAVLARCANRIRIAGAGAATSDTDIIARRWLPIDADPIRPAEISASDAEHRAALEAARHIRSFLAELGWPEPLLADSGNGGHLLYRIDLPAIDLTGLERPVRSGVRSGGLVERVLAALAARFNDERVHVDVRVFNPARIWKLYGTWARKGDDTPDRPHRLARILEGPQGEPEVVAREMLEQMAGPGGAEMGRRGDTGIAVPNTQEARLSHFSLDRWLAEHNVPVEAARPWHEGRRWIFPVCPWDPQHLRSAYIVELPNGAIAAGCLHNSCTGRDWAELRAMFEPGSSSRHRPSTPDQGSNSAAPEPAWTADPGRSATDQGPSFAGHSLLAEIASWPVVTQRAERPAAEARAAELVGRCAGLDRAALLQVAAALRGRGLGSVFVRQWLVAVHEQQRKLGSDSAMLEPPEYEAEDGRTYRVTWELGTGGEPQPRRAVVADFALRIVEETVAEDGRVWFGLAGEAADGRALRLELTATEFADDRMLQAAVTAAAGPCCPVRANMLRHLRPAIQLLTPADVPRARRFDRTGWEAGAGIWRLGEEGDFSPALHLPVGAGASDAETARDDRARDCFAETARIDEGESARNDEGESARIDQGESVRSQRPPAGNDQAEAARNAAAAGPLRSPAPPPPCSPAPCEAPCKGLHFLLPGREPEGVVVRLPRKLPYRIEPGGDLAQGLLALEAALTAADPRRTTVLLAAMLGAPLARRAGLEGERYGVFLSGRTGSLKTSTAQVLMCIYGAGFIEDQYLLKMGEGATRNAIMGYAAHVHDLPFLVDNFKPSTGDGARGFVSLLHNLLEGGDRERLTRTAELRESRPVHCWPIFTGEDVPDADTAALARLLTLPFDPPRDDDARLAALSRAQALAGHLPAIGEAWLAWLEGQDGAAIATEAGARFAGLRGRWLDYLRDRHPDMANPLRVASSLACNELAWEALHCHPQLGALAARFEEAHIAGVNQAAGDAAGRTAVSLEAVRFLAVLRELLATGRCELIAKGGGQRPVGSNAGSGDDRPDRSPKTCQVSYAADAPPLPERTLGWECPDGSVYLLPELARREVERVLGPGGLNAISSRTLHEQLAELGLIAGRDPGRYTRKVREGGRTHNVLHLLPDALEG